MIVFCDKCNKSYPTNIERVDGNTFLCPWCGNEEDTLSADSFEFIITCPVCKSNNISIERKDDGACCKRSYWFDFTCCSCGEDEMLVA